MFVKFLAHFSIWPEKAENMANIGDQVIEDTSKDDERILKMLEKSLPP